MRRAAALVAGITIATIFGLGGIGTAAAVSPALKIEPGAKWTLEVGGGGCVVDTFHSNGTFTGDKYGDSGTWTGGGRTIDVKVTAGGDDDLVFKGTFTRTPVIEYTGRIRVYLPEGTGRLVKGVVKFHGNTC